MLQHALVPEVLGSAHRDATYGELVDRASRAVVTASMLPQDRFAHADDARQELLGYLRFLRIAGQHVDLLGRLAGSDAEDIRAFGRHLLTTLKPNDGGGAWRKAATFVGAADDLLRSHLDQGLSARTSEAEELLTEPRLLAAARASVNLLATAATARSRLASRVAAAERGPAGDGRTSANLFLTARRAERHIHVHGRAALWDLHRLGIDGVSPSLDRLMPPAATAAAPSPHFESALAALRSLRQLSYGQARGQIPASPASLKDLAQLGEAATVPDLEWLAPPTTGLASVQHAVVIDSLSAAHSRWAQAGRRLTTSVQGLTQAPGRYGEAVRHLQAMVVQQPSTRAAVINALPTLATEASRTVLELAGVSDG